MYHYQAVLHTENKNLKFFFRSKINKKSDYRSPQGTGNNTKQTEAAEVHVLIH